MAVLSALYDGDFDGVEFWEQTDQAGWLPGRPIGTEGSLISLGNGVHVYSNMGQSEPPFDLVVGVDTAEYDSLVSKQGETGTLNWSRGAQTATLLDIIPSPGKAGSLAAYTVTLRFFADELPTNVVPSNAWLTQTGLPWLTQSGDPWVTEG